MIPSGQPASEQQKVIIDNRQKTDWGPSEVQEQVDGEEVLDPDNVRSIFNTVLNIVNNKFEHEYLDKVARLLDDHLICQSTDDSVAGQKYSIPGLPRTKFLAHPVCSIWFNTIRWVWGPAMPEVLVIDKMGLRKTVAWVAVAMISRLDAKKVLMGLLLFIVWGITIDEWVNIAQNNIPRIIGEERKWYLLRRHHSVPCCFMQIQKTTHQGHPVLMSAL